jgi:Fic family protein
LQSIDPVTRAGQFVKQSEGHFAFVPAPVPPVPPVEFDAELTRLLSDADRALGRLDGVTSVLPNPELFVAMYVRHEAVLSSQIEGTQSTLEDVLEFEIDALGEDRPRDIEEVVNYIRAMNRGLARLDELPLSLRLIREIHQELLSGVRGAHRGPGEFRRIQNFIGGPGATLATATFVPPPVPEMHEALDGFERFLHDTESLPVLVHCGIAHAHFETIHPFIDGNGRVGRLLITLLLCERGVLRRPLLYLSHYLRANRAEYYDRLTAIRRRGDWEGWLKFFLRGVAQVSQQATDTARAILVMREEHRARVANELGGGAAAFRLLDLLFQQPIVTVRLVERHLESSYVTANKLVAGFERLGLLRETTGWQRNRRYAYQPYLNLFGPSLGAPAEADEVPVPTTEVME